MESLLDPVMHGKTTKIERWNWTVVDKPGEFKLIHKKALTIDRDHYQRTQTASKVLRIAREWSWAACGALLTACRDAQFYVFDGGHRLLAAEKRADIELLPCLVFPLVSVKDEAMAFIRSNLNRKSMTSLEKFKGLVQAGDADAQFCKELVEQYGRVIVGGAHANTAQCIGAIYDAAKGERETLKKVWPLFCEICAGRTLHVHILKALLYMEKHMLPGNSLEDKRWYDRMIWLGYDEILIKARAVAALHGKGGGAQWAEGILIGLNYKLRNKLELRGISIPQE